ncbi:hypothetical protein [Coprobacter tertius]|uniref:Secreted protein n=1 Tax=Coprobacter tertius TaxID=2944915 RepID=A0ABT1MGL5_9BACT|nr:hypothetical protein [Coprobacter tertius]MCP9610823.1 hypothetical protein [Coprobacter tertius]
MIFKNVIIIFIVIFTPFIFFGQNKTDKIKSKYYYDVDSILTLRCDSIGNDLNVYFYTKSKQKYNVCMDFNYNGGYKALSAYCDSVYFNREDYNYDELNATALYSILFDKNLKIKDIRILKRNAYNNSKYNYDLLIKKILYSTESRWSKYDKDNNCKWYFYLGVFDVR